MAKEKFGSMIDGYYLNVLSTVPQKLRQIPHKIHTVNRDMDTLFQEYPALLVPPTVSGRNISPHLPVAFHTKRPIRPFPNNLPESTEVTIRHAESSRRG